MTDNGIFKSINLTVMVCGVMHMKCSCCVCDVTHIKFSKA